MATKTMANHQLTPHFKVSEFVCKDGSGIPIHLASNLRLLVVNLELIRGLFNRSIIVNSGYRTRSYNTKVGGVPNSQHLLANAVDFSVQGFSPHYVFGKVRKLMKDGIIEAGALILYNTFVHYDRRGYMLFLDYRKKSKL